MLEVPAARIRLLQDAPVQAGRDYVLYWMVAARRPNWNFALDRALEWGHRLQRPVVVLEALRAAYPQASPRLHAFALAGMRDNAAAFANTPIRYLPHVESTPGASAGLLETMCERACVLLSDDWPCFFIPRMQLALAARIDVRFELIDGNGITRLADSPQEFVSAYSFRRWFQKRGSELVAEAPNPDPLARCQLPRVSALAVESDARWSFEVPGKNLDTVIRKLSLAGTAPRIATMEGGFRAAERRLLEFKQQSLADYDSRRNVPHASGTSGLSPYLHFGHISAHQILHRVCEGEDVLLPTGARTATGARAGWWGLGASREAFLDQLIIWRELGFHFCRHRSDYLSLESLPNWAVRTLELHWDDLRPRVYTLQEFEAAATHDAVWNAAQRQLRETGTIHNYLRMLWGKKILHWSADPQQALEIMLTLNDRWALDGRDPNSYSGIFWILGRFDRAWGPERPVFGTVRYMSTESTLRKLPMAEYLNRFGGSSPVKKRAKV